MSYISHKALLHGFPIKLELIKNIYTNMKNNLEVYFNNLQELRDKVKQQNKKEIRRVAQLVFNKGRINAYQFYAILSKNQ